MTEDLVRLSVVHGVGRVTLDSPHNRNALSRTLLAQLHARITDALADDAVRVIVLTGAGPAFCAGADLKEAAAPDAAGQAAQPVPFPDVLTLLWESRKPVVARVNGTARAGGLGLIAACDVAVAPDTATFAFSEVRLGLVPAVIAVTCLRRMHPRAAAEYMLTGETFDAKRAAEIGLLSRSVPADELDEAVDRYASMLLRAAPEAVAITKDLVRSVPAMTLDEGFARMTALSEQRFASAEGREGIAAFRERRRPSWVAAGDAR